MVSYIIRRLFYGIVLMAGVVVLNFFLIRLAIPVAVSVAGCSSASDFGTLRVGIDAPPREYRDDGRTGGARGK